MKSAAPLARQLQALALPLRYSRRTTGFFQARSANAPSRDAGILFMVPPCRPYATVGSSEAPSKPIIDLSSKLPVGQRSDGTPKEKLVILGSGWAGYSLVRSVDKSKYDVYLVSPNTYFAMTPLLASAACASLPLQSVMEPVRETADTLFYHAWCDGIDFDKKKLRLTPAYPPPFRAEDPLESAEQKGTNNGSVPNARGGHSSAMVRPPHRRAIEGSDTAADAATTRHHSHDPQENWKSQEEGRSYALPFDKLVIAAGTYNRTFNTPGVVENAWFLKDVQNARAIRWRVLECFEQAEHPELTDEQRRNLLNFVVVGGGPTGAEFASALYDLIHSDIKRIFPQLYPLAQITIFDAAGNILNSYDENLQKYAREMFLHDGIHLKLNRKPVRVERGKFVVEPDGEVPFGMLVWSTGNTQGPLVRSITEVKKDKAGGLLTNGKLEVLPAEGQNADAFHGVYALGDCAQIEEYSLPATAQVASQKAAYLATLLNGRANDEKSFRWHNKGSMTRLSSGRGIAQLSAVKLEGKSAGALWNSTYGLYLTASWRNRFSIPFNWMLNKIFGRTLSRM
ncbi:unnamed protein product [Parajaminaea phylloscopi]